MRSRVPWRRRASMLLAFALVVAACTGDDGGDEVATTSTLPPARTLVRVGTDEWPECLNPLTCDADGALRDLVLRHVLPVAMEIDGDGRPVPSPLLDGTPEIGGGGEEAPFTVTFRIAPEARWADDRPVTSSDFRATWSAVVATPGADVGIYADVVAVDDTDPLVAVVELRRPRADWADLFGGTHGWVLQGDALGSDLDLTGRFRSDLPFSAGPFRLAAWDRDVAVLAAVESYWDADRVPEVDQVRIERRRDAADVDGFDLVIPALDAGEAPPDGFDSIDVATTEVIGIWFDQRSPLLATKAHRDALAVAFDRAALVDDLAGGDVVACLGWLPAVGPWCDGDDLPPGLFEPDLARFALAVEGWVAGEDGILARDGEPFGVTVTHDPAVAGTADIADELARRFDDIGLAVSSGEISTVEWAADRSSDASTGVGVFAYDVGIHPLVIELYGCPRGIESSVLAWCPPELVEAARTMLTTVDDEALLEVARSIGDQAADALAWIPLARRHRPIHVRSDRVTLPDGRAPDGGPLDRLHDLEVRSG